MKEWNNYNLSDIDCINIYLLFSFIIVTHWKPINIHIFSETFKNGLLIVILIMLCDDEILLRHFNMAFA